jgi:hypothetical protein
VDRDFLLLVAFYGLYFVWVLVPLLPAVIIYLLFPNAPVQTKWKIAGIALKAGGASGFYFTILGLAYFNFVAPVTDYIKNMHLPYWTVEVPITFVDAVTPIAAAEQLTVDPFAYEFRQTDEKHYLAKLRFSEISGETPEYITLIVRDGQGKRQGLGYIKLKEMRTTENTSRSRKWIDLTKADPIPIRPILAGGQNTPAVTDLPSKLQQGLEAPDSPAKK